MRSHPFLLILFCLLISGITACKNSEEADRLHNLGDTYREQNNFQAAKKAYQKSLVLKKKLYGTEHESVALTLNNLAELYRVQGKYAQAQSLLKRSLAILKKVFGKEHPDVASSLNNLALLYSDQGDYAQKPSRC